jgi:hypothetical protein
MGAVGNAPVLFLAVVQKGFNSPAGAHKTVIKIKIYFTGQGMPTARALLVLLAAFLTFTV